MSQPEGKLRSHAMSKKDKLHIQVRLNPNIQGFQQPVSIFYQRLPDPAPTTGKLHRTHIHTGREIILPGLKHLTAPARIRQTEQPEISMPVRPERRYPQMRSFHDVIF
jgi:hypothetical protein